ncbi:MAG TPA: glutamyl-tRNA reductase [Acidobacteriota bacterium]|nr:glutamyl-tRNA reductase [Acidobacteriota bacterium]HNT16434.1 glutamyl-tRNA reductase [Acidobacteriota bacterium]
MALNRLAMTGISHGEAPVETREKLAFGDDERLSFLRWLGNRGVPGAVLLSTCNRVELYAELPPETDPLALADLLLENRELPPDGRNLFRTMTGRDMVRHLFRVASGLDSMILGEPQVLGQVKEAYFASRSGRTITTQLNLVFQRAMYVARKVRTESGIGRHPVTVSYAAFNLARSVFSEIGAKKVLLLGAGEMARIIASHFYDEGSRNVAVANRTSARAGDIASRFDARVVPWESFPDELCRADLVIASTAAAKPVITREMLLSAMKRRKWAPLMIIDIAVPRNTEEGAGDIDGVYLFNIDDLQRSADLGLEERKRRAVVAERMVEEEVALYGHFLEHAELPRLIERVVERAGRMAEAETGTLLSKLGISGKEEEDLVRRSVMKIVHRLMHGPITQLKKLVLEEERDEAAEVFERFFLDSDTGGRRGGGTEGG